MTGRVVPVKTLSRGAAVLALLLSVSAGAQDDGETPGVTDVTQTLCSELAAGSEQDRAFSLMFYYGYFAGREGATTIDGSAVSGHLTAVRDHCNANPDSTVVDAFVAALGG